MSIITVRRHDVTTEEVTDVLGGGLDPRYDVEPGVDARPEVGRVAEHLSE